MFIALFSATINNNNNNSATKQPYEIVFLYRGKEGAARSKKLGHSFSVALRSTFFVLPSPSIASL